MSLYATRWLSDGSPFDCRFESAYPGLAAWSGINGLKDAVRRVAGAASTQEVLFASRTTAVARFAIRQLVRRCQRPLTVDLLWPGFRRLLIRESRRHNKTFSIVHLRRALLSKQASVSAIVDAIAAAYQCFNCDGLMLPAVSHDGVRLPVTDIVRAIASIRPPRWIVVDGAQAIGHVDCPEVRTADMFLASTHKWLSSGLPLGIAICGERVDRDTEIRIPDPLFRLSQELTGCRANAFGETVNAVPLVTAAAALQDQLSRDAVIQSQLQQQRAAVTHVVQAAGWRIVEPAPEFQTRIVLIRAPLGNLLRASENELAKQFQRRGTAVTCYPGGLVRLSIPRPGLKPMELNCLYEALESIARRVAAPRQSNLSSPSSNLASR